MGKDSGKRGPWRINRSKCTHHFGVEAELNVSSATDERSTIVDVAAAYPRNMMSLKSLTSSHERTMLLLENIQEQLMGGLRQISNE